MLAQAIEQPPGERSRRHPVGAGQVDDLALETVAGRQPLVLVEHLPRVGGQLLALAEVLGQLAHHRLNQRGDPDGMLDVGLGIHHADLDRAEARMRAHVMPQVGVVVHHTGLDHELDPPLVVGPVVVGGWDPDPGEGTKDRRPGRGQPGRVGAPERRVGRQSQQHRQVDAHAVGDVDRLVGVVEPDVNVHAEDQLLAGDEPHRRDQVAVARPGADPLVLPHRKRVRAGRSDRHALARRGRGHLLSQRPQLL